MKLKLILFTLLTLIVLLSLYIYKGANKQTTTPINKIKYVAIGDSYTIGLGLKEEDRWPNIMTDHLKEMGVEIELVANPAVSGFTVRDAIGIELPIAAAIKPDFVTILIGANDNFMKRSKDDYRTDLIELLNKIQEILSNPKNIVLITIPDYSKSPSAQGLNEENLSEFIDSYNEVIKEEGKKRGLVVADIFLVSQTMTGEEDYILDGLHPSRAGYSKWEKVIFPAVFLFLQDNNDSSRRKSR